MSYSVPMPPYSSIRRRVRSKPRRGQPAKSEKSALRLAVYNRAEGRCELRLTSKCLVGPLPFDGDVFERGHLVHLKSKGSGGAWSMENCRWGYHECHLGEMHQKGTKFEGGDIGRA
jgi:hypothetical protein